MNSNNQFTYGLHAVLALLQRNPTQVLRLSVAKERQDKKIEAILELAKQHSISVDFSSRQELDGITESANHQGVVAFYTKSLTYSERDLRKYIEQLTTPPSLLILDGIQDPHNLGACFRTADAAGVHLIIAPKDKSVGMTPIVSKVASGAAEKIPFFQVTNLVRTMEELKELGIWIYGAAEEAEQSIYQTNFSGPIAFVLGAEGKGLRRLTREHCDVLIKIPMFGLVSSLNVSVATGVILFEAVRQRLSS